MELFSDQMTINLKVFCVTPRFPNNVNNTLKSEYSTLNGMSHYISSINRVNVLFIKTTLSKFNYITAENLISLFNKFGTTAST